MIKDEAWLAEKRAQIEAYGKANKETDKGGTVFCGSSLMERFPAAEWTEGRVVNRGIGGFTISEYRDAADICIYELEPAEIFINIGTNDMNEPGFSAAGIIGEYEDFLREIEERLPGVKIHIMSYYPVNDDTDDDFMKEELKVRTNEVIDRANILLKDMAERNGYAYIDAAQVLKDEDGRLKKEYSVDGVHINEKGYRQVFSIVSEWL